MEPAYILRPDEDTGSIWLVNTSVEDERYEVFKHVQPEEVAGQNEQNVSVQEVSVQEEDDWGHYDPWDEMLPMKEGMSDQEGEHVQKEDHEEEECWMSCPTPKIPQGDPSGSAKATPNEPNNLMEVMFEKKEAMPPKEPCEAVQGHKEDEEPGDGIHTSKKEEGIVFPIPNREGEEGGSNETQYLQKKDEDGDYKYEDRGNEPTSGGEDRGNEPTRGEGDRGNLTPTHEGEGVEEGHESLNHFKLGGCYLNQPSLRGSVEIWETPWLTTEGGSQEEQATKLKEEGEVKSEPKMCSKSMFESNHVKLDLCDQRRSSLRGSVEMTQHRLKEHMLEGRGTRDGRRHTKSGRDSLDDQVPNGVGLVIMNDPGRSQPTVLDLRQVVRGRWPKERDQSDRDTKGGSNRTNRVKLGDRRKVDAQGVKEAVHVQANMAGLIQVMSKEVASKDKAIMTGLEELANGLSERSCISDNEKCPRHLTEHEEMGRGQTRKGLRIKHSKDQHITRERASKHLTERLHHTDQRTTKRVTRTSMCTLSELVSLQPNQNQNHVEEP